MINFNPMQLMQMMKGGGNPQQMVMGMLQQQAGNNPVLKNALNMAQQGDSKGLENLVRNIAKEKGVNPDEMMQQVMGQMGQFGMK